MRLVIEHLEPHLSKWLLIEYENASRLTGGNILFTNVKNPSWRKILSKFGEVSSKSVIEHYPAGTDIIILDPIATKSLSPEEINKETWIVIGGILGAHPPLRRTRKLLSSRMPWAKKRSIGRWQFPIDSAVYIALLISKGIPLEAIPVKQGLEMVVEQKGTYKHTIYLPYAYPLVNGKPLISKKLIEYLIEEGMQLD